MSYRRFKQGAFQRFNDWAAEHIEGIFIQWAAVTIIEILNGIGIWESLVSSWFNAYQIVDTALTWIFYLDTIFFVYSAIISLFKGTFANILNLFSQKGGGGRKRR
jgi:hypothetical protein